MLQWKKWSKVGDNIGIPIKKGKKSVLIISLILSTSLYRQLFCWQRHWAGETRHQFVLGIDEPSALK